MAASGPPLPPPAGAPPLPAGAPPPAPPAPTVALGPEEIDHYSRERAVSCTAAHRFLTTLRDRHRATQNDDCLHDLTDSQEFNWKAWVSQEA